jgi:hypothetical protein
MGAPSTTAFTESVTRPTHPAAKVRAGPLGWKCYNFRNPGGSAFEDAVQLIDEHPPFRRIVRRSAKLITHFSSKALEPVQLIDAVLILAAVEDKGSAEAHHVHDRMIADDLSLKTPIHLLNGGIVATCVTIRAYREGPLH